jgi:hypothetical protein
MVVPVSDAYGEDLPFSETISVDTTLQTGEKGVALCL